MSVYEALDSTEFSNFADLLTYEMQTFDADAIADYIDEKERWQNRKLKYSNTYDLMER